MKTYQVKKHIIQRSRDAHSRIDGTPSYLRYNIMKRNSIGKTFVVSSRSKRKITLPSLKCLEQPPLADDE